MPRSAQKTREPRTIARRGASHVACQALCGPGRCVTTSVSPRESHSVQQVLWFAEVTVDADVLWQAAGEEKHLLLSR